MLRFFQVFSGTGVSFPLSGMWETNSHRGRFVVLAMSDTGMESPHDPVFLHRASVRMLYTD